VSKAPHQPSRTPSPPAWAAAPLAVVLAHADSFNWDEALLVLAPIALIAGVLLYVNRKLQHGLDGFDDDETAPDEDQSAGA